MLLFKAQRTINPLKFFCSSIMVQFYVLWTISNILYAGSDAPSWTFCYHLPWGTWYPQSCPHNFGHLPSRGEWPTFSVCTLWYLHTWVNKVSTSEVHSVSDLLVYSLLSKAAVGKQCIFIPHSIGLLDITLWVEIGKTKCNSGMMRRTMIWEPEHLWVVVLVLFSIVGHILLFLWNLWVILYLLSGRGIVCF